MVDIVDSYQIMPGSVAKACFDHDLRMEVKALRGDCFPFQPSQPCRVLFRSMGFMTALEENIHCSHWRSGSRGC